MAELSALGATGHRLVLFDRVEFYWYYRELGSAAFQVALVLTGQSFEEALAEGESLVHASRRFARLLRPEVWIIGNEWNVANDASWPPGGDDGFIETFVAAAQGIRSIQPGAKLYVGGLYSQERIADRIGEVLPRIKESGVDVIDGIDLHLYDESEEQAVDILENVRERFGTEVAMFEWNWSGPDRKIGEYQQKLNDLTDHSCWYCWSDGQLPRHGLVTADWREGKDEEKKDVYGEYQAALRL